MKNKMWMVGTMLIAFLVWMMASQNTTAQQSEIGRYQIEAADLDDDRPTGFVIWPSAEVETIANRLEREIGNRAMVYETIRTDDGHSVYFVLRGLT